MHVRLSGPVAAPTERFNTRLSAGEARSWNVATYAADAMFR